MTIKSDIKYLRKEKESKSPKKYKMTKEIKELFKRVENLEEYFLGKNPKKHKDYKYFSQK